VLRSGTKLKGLKGTSVEVESEKDKDKGAIPLPHESELEKKKEKETMSIPPKPYMPPLPFPQRFARAKLESQFSKFLDMLKQLHVNVPFFDALSQMSLYAKFLKEIFSKKRKIDEHETVALGEECSVVVLNQLPAKLKDPDSFSIPCTIGNVSIDRALCDLGSSVSLMSYTMFKRLGLGELTPTGIFLQLADRSIKYPMGILEDVPIKVGEFYVPIDFVALDIAEDCRTQIILGRPFLATARCKIDVKEGRLTFDVGEHHAEFGLFENLEASSATFSCCGCETVESNEPKNLPDTNLNDPSSISCALFEGHGLDNGKEDSFPPNIVETEPCAVDEGYLSECYRFITFWMSILPVNGGLQEEVEDMKFEFGPYDGDRPKMRVNIDPKLWKLLRSKKDLNPELLRWFLLLWQFYVEIVDKG